MSRGKRHKLELFHLQFIGKKSSLNSIAQNTPTAFLHRGQNSPNECPDMKQNNLMVRLQ